MPIITKKGLPVNDILREEKIQILDELADGCSNSKEILQIAILEELQQSLEMYVMAQEHLEQQL